jgi:hypothetical protein
MDVRGKRGAELSANVTETRRPRAAAFQCMGEVACRFLRQA